MFMKTEFLNRVRRFNLWVPIVMTAIMMIACGDADFSATDQDGGNTGSVAFRVVWEGGQDAGQKNHARALPDNCPGISTVEATIFTEDMTAYRGGPWLCSARTGIISSVPVGQNRILVLIGRNNADEIVYYGSKSGIEVLANIENQAGDVIATYSMPEPSLPVNGGTVDSGNVVLQWSAVAGAADYYLVLSNDFDFNGIVLDATTFNTSYTLTSLSADTTYYWYVVARYSEEDYGLETDEWRFTTSADYTPGGTLPAPAELYAYPADGEITLSWSAVQGAEGYNLYFREAASVGLVQEVTIGNSTKEPSPGADTVYVHTGLTNGRVYSYAVTAYNTAGESELSAQEDMIPAWSNTYQPSLWKNTRVSTILGSLPSVEIDNEDWYVFDVKEDLQLIHVECLFAHADGDINIELFDAAGYSAELAQSTDDNEIIDYLSEYGGLFFIRVFTNGPAADYDLEWNTSLNAINVPGDYGSIQAAIDAASNGDIVLVADGNRVILGADGIDFKGKAITVRSENGPENCIISGGGDGRGFIFQSGEQSDSVLSGFTITNGNISGWGAGGGGILCEGASPTISNCIITGNVVDTSAYGGGGISCLFSANPIIVNCVIENNSAVDSGGGGGIYCDNASPTIRNCTIVNNSAGTDSGGGIYISGPSSTTITNSIFWGNSPDQIDYGSAAPVVTFSNIEGGFPGNSNKESNPLFTGAGNYTLATGSPCIDAGTASGAPSSDIIGIARPQGDGYDMGAYESQ